MDISDRLRELGRNLYWTWHPEVIEIFRDLDPLLWRQLNHNPAEFLSRLPKGTLEARTSELALDARISRCFHQLHGYLGAKTTWGARHAGPLRAFPVAYFSAEFGLHESLPLYSGGLGVLAGDHLKAASDMGVPLVGVGLFYAKGYFSQRLDETGWQREEYFASDVKNLPMEPLAGPDGRPLRVDVTTRRGDIRAGVWSAHVGRNRLILLDTNVDGNTEENRALTSQLYGGDRRVRIRQELVLGVGGLRALEALGICPGAIHLNEGHSAFAVLELARQLMERDSRPFEQVREKAAAMTIFTTHTPVEAGHDRFDPQLVEETLGPLREQLGLAEKDFLGLGRKNPDDPTEPFCMTVLGLRMSRFRNAVSSIHARVARAMWRDVWPEWSEDRVPIGHVTNGVHIASWLAVPMAELYDSCLEENWQGRVHEARTWAGIDRIDDVELWEQQQILKAHLVEYVRRCVERQEQARGLASGGRRSPGDRLDPAALTIGFARRFASYKRAILLFRDVERLARLVGDPRRPVQVVFAGKAHPADEEGKRLIQEVFQAARNERFGGRIVFIEDHDFNVGRHLVQGVDVWLNTPRRPLEACGTSGMKAILNGGLNLSTLDGWWAQAYDGTNGFAIGCGGEHADPDRQDEMDAEGLYEVLETQVVPLFYGRDEAGVPRGWVARQKNAIRALAWRFCAHRMVTDYGLRCYLPAAGGGTTPGPTGRGTGG